MLRNRMQEPEYKMGWANKCKRRKVDSGREGGPRKRVARGQKYAGGNFACDHLTCLFGKKRYFGGKIPTGGIKGSLPLWSDGAAKKKTSHAKQNELGSCMGGVKRKKKGNRENEP